MSDIDRLIEQLREVRGVTESSAEGLVEEYQTMETISWAVRRDKEDVQTEFKIDPDGLWDERRDEELWGPYYQWKRQLEIPDRRQDHIEKYLEGWRQRLDDYCGTGEE